MVGALVTFPLEVVKTRLQSSTHMASMRLAAGLPPPGALSPTASPGSSAMRHVRLIGRSFAIVYGEGGIRSLYAGLGPTLTGVIPSRALQFSSYNAYKNLLLKYVVEPTANGETSPVVHMGAAAMASVTVTTFTCPIWVIKTRMQLQSNANKGGERAYKNSIDCLLKIVRNEGVRGLYRGLAASYFGMFESTIQFALYEHLKASRAERNRKRGISQDLQPLSSLSRTHQGKRVGSVERVFVDRVHWVDVSSNPSQLNTWPLFISLAHLYFPPFFLHTTSP